MKKVTKRLLSKIDFKWEFKKELGRQGANRFCTRYLYRATKAINDELREMGSNARVVFSKINNSSKQVVNKYIKNNS